jgi:AcrR family transcriptional regulator
MARETKISQEMVINGALKLVQREGYDALNARSLAKELGCSTQPLFSRFKNIDDLKNALIERIYNIYLERLYASVESGKYPSYKATGMAYVEFAKEEKNFFKLLFMRDRTDEQKLVSADWEIAVSMIREIFDISKEEADKIHAQMWFFVHGIAVMLATGFEEIDLDTASQYITDIYNGVKLRYGVKL